MPLCSMTGFARDETSAEGYRLAWEIRSVNGRSLDLKLRLPQGFEALDRPLRDRAGARLSRGNVMAVLEIADTRHGETAIVNEARLLEILKVTERLVSEGKALTPQADGLLALKGVLEAGDGAAERVQASDLLKDAAIAAFERALADLVTNRLDEGAQIRRALFERIERIGELTEAARIDPARTPEAIGTRIAEQLARLGDDTFDAARLHQEATLIAVKADIGEEIDRLAGHVIAARTLIDADEPIGRRFDFLAQEMNRESNTICSKSNAASLTAIGLDLKVAVDQLREQVQNVE